MDGFDAASEQAAQDRLLDMPLAHLSGVRRGALQAGLKRTVDVAFSIAALIVLAPALAAISVAIRLDSPGPILFKQRRHGYMNEEVLVWKFRSMRAEASDYAAIRQVSAGDDRVTRVGRFLRRTSLDELPQLWNVIRGEMSLVGPRPHAIGMLTGGAEASQLVATYAHRHRMKPGLTGWAAVNGSRGPVDTPEAVRRRVSLDLEYVERQSLWLDLSIMARTLPCVRWATAAPCAEPRGQRRPAPSISSTVALATTSGRSNIIRCEDLATRWSAFRNRAASCRCMFCQTLAPGSSVPANPPSAFPAVSTMTGDIP